MNLYDSDWDVERSYGDARMRMMHVGRRLGSELLGATVFEIEPGIPGLYHFHSRKRGVGARPRGNSHAAHTGGRARPGTG